MDFNVIEIVELYGNSKHRYGRFTISLRKNLLLHYNYFHYNRKTNTFEEICLGDAQVLFTKRHCNPTIDNEAWAARMEKHLERLLEKHIALLALKKG